jgi:proteasome alpha subunit
MRGYSYDRRDVTGRGLANAYAQTLGAIFSSGGEKPYEVELFVGEVGTVPEEDQIFRLTYDGQVADEQGFAAMGGSAESVTGHIREHYRPGLSLADTLRLAVEALGRQESGSRTIPVESLEVAVLDRTRSQKRKFKRLTDPQLADLLGDRADSQPREPGTSARPETAGAPGTTAVEDDAPVAPPADDA